MSWHMPAEWAPHERTWMAFPSKGYTLGDDPHEARSTWAAVAQAVARYEPVTVVVDPADAAVAAEYLGDKVEIVYAELDDAWMRDIGPTFVVDGDKLGAVDWIFNGWGAQSWASWSSDALIGKFVAGLAAAEVVSSPIVNEGGGIHVDGKGTVLVTESVQLDPGRNPGLTKADIEAELARTLGVSKAIWLPYGLTRDEDDFGTRGHVDIVATFASPGVVLVHDQRNPEHPDYVRSQLFCELLSAATDAAGRQLEVVRVPAPSVLRDGEGFVDYSYINHLVCNDGVVACSYNDPVDDEAAAILSTAYGRPVTTVDARPLFARGGGIHCITQQQPAVR
ncbi:agmatine/peptidylarginine deiminase [Smaragdicoccus niigatensis]|uniref:agmatine deiminase family protein n=1 Tax=Smaragdicoccus niigatensis TaxID=359359 RepID=UPI000372F997|nr:agmatine deiminase family protein [Smaragdicoccus niigatensis]